MMNPLYIIMHYTKQLTEGIFLPEDNSIRRELTRILREEEFIFHNGDPRQVHPNIPKDRPIRVCGQMLDICVQQQHQALLKAGYNSELYRQASLDSDDIPDY